MRAAAQPNAAVVEKLGMHFIRVMEDGTEPSGDNPMIKVVAPSGKVGFVPADAISPLGNDAICYAKEGGGWKIAGFLGGASVSDFESNCAARAGIGARRNCFSCRPEQRGA